MNSALKPPAAQLGTSSQRRVLTRWAAYALAVYILGFGFFVSVVPTPLYGSYREA